MPTCPAVPDNIIISPAMTATPPEHTVPPRPRSAVEEYAVKWGKTAYPSYFTSAVYLASIPGAVLKTKGFLSFMELSAFCFTNAGTGYITTQDWASGSQVGTLAGITHFVILLRRNSSLVPADSPSYFARSTNRGLSLASLLLHGVVAGNTVIQGFTWKAARERRAEWAKNNSSS